MSPTMAMAMPTVMYNPTFDTMNRHDYGIKKHRKNPSTGGGRAWSEDEVCVFVMSNLEPGGSGQHGNHLWLPKKLVTIIRHVEESY